MPRLVRVLLLTAAASAVLSGCEREREPTPAPAPAATPSPGNVTPADAAAPLAFESKNQFAEVKLELPAAIKGHPDLHAQLYAASVRDLRQFVEGAQADRTEAGGDDEMPPYAKTILFKPGAETGKLFSLSQMNWDFTGGAHGNAQWGSVLWDKALKRRITAADLFRKGANMAALDQALCAAANTAKKARDPAAETVSLTPGAMWTCPRAAQTAFVLAPGTTPGKAGGLTFLIAPYQIDSFAAGTYELTVPLSAFASLLAPAYADEFAGQPVKSGDVTDRG